MLALSKAMQRRLFSAGRRLSAAVMEDIRIERLSESNRKQVLELLLTSFRKDEPISSTLRVSDKHAIPVFNDLFIEPALQYALSNVAIDTRSDRVVAVYVGSVHRKDDQHDTYQMDDPANPFVTIMDFLDILGSGIWQYLSPESKMFCKNDIVSIHADYRGLKLFRVLKEMCNREAQRLGCTHAVSLATSYTSQKLNEKLGFKTYRFINYADYRVLGKQVFVDVPAPHVCAKLMIMKY